VPIGAQDEVKNAYWALFDVDDLIAGGRGCPARRWIWVGPP
jgi:hypothetical protein